MHADGWPHAASKDKRDGSKQDWHPDYFGLKNPVVQQIFLRENVLRVPLL